MTALGNFYDFSQIHLGAKDERCGEIFITYSRNIIIHCTICTSNFESYNYFLDHLSTEHYEEVQEEVIEIDAETETAVQNVQINFKPIIGQIEEVFLEEPNSLSVNETRHTADEFEEYDFEKINDEEETEAQNLYKQFLDETSKSSSSSRKSDEVKSFSCEKCGKVFTRNRYLSRHRKTHTKGPKTHTNGTRTQTNERNHQCHICGLTYTTRAGLDLHARRHTGIKPISCGFCSKRFYTLGEATPHRRLHTGIRPYVCSTCGMTFTNSGGFKLHVMKHNSEPSIKCNFCGKGFYVKTELRDHMVVHTKEKPFVCHICGSRFPRHHSMMRHVKLMHERNKE